MSAETTSSNTEETTGPAPEVIAEARTMGWVPQEEFRGDKSKWVDADAYVDRARTVMPILRHTNQALTQNVLQLTQRVNQLSEELNAQKSDFTTMEEFYNEQLVERVASAKKELLKQIKEAKDSGDSELEVELLDQLTDLKSSAKGLEKGKADDKQESGQPQEPPMHPAMQAWTAKNADWFGVDPVKTQMAVGIGHLVKARNPALAGKAFYDAVDEEMARQTGQEDNTPPRAPSKVAGSRGGATSGDRGGRTYADLPAEAKAVCDKYAKRFVNPNGQFKTEADYRRHYVKQLEETGYFQQ